MSGGLWAAKGPQHFHRDATDSRLLAATTNGSRFTSPQGMLFFRRFMDSAFATAKSLARECATIGAR
jgi:hypothetical protein